MLFYRSPAQHVRCAVVPQSIWCLFCVPFKWSTRRSNWLGTLTRVYGVRLVNTDIALERFLQCRRARAATKLWWVLARTLRGACWLFSEFFEAVQGRQAARRARSGQRSRGLGAGSTGTWCVSENWGRSFSDIRGPLPMPTRQSVRCAPSRDHSTLGSG